MKRTKALKYFSTYFYSILVDFSLEDQDGYNLEQNGHHYKNRNYVLNLHTSQNSCLKVSFVCSD